MLTETENVRVTGELSFLEVKPQKILSLRDKNRVSGNRFAVNRNQIVLMAAVA